MIQRLDQLNEFDRRPVSPDRLQSGMYFAASFAGEHVAATEFVIGALFVAGGAGARDVILGLLLGNLLAVLSWTLLCAPIAVQTRLTLYWYLRRIAGPAVTIVYNLLNAALYCVLAGCMITVAASAVRIPFGIQPQTGWLPTDPWFVLVTVVVGAVVVLLAILGFKRLAQFASVCSPWMLVMFVAGALVLLPQVVSFSGLGGLWQAAQERIWTGRPPYESMVVVPEGEGNDRRPYIELRFADDMELLAVGAAGQAGPGDALRPATPGTPLTGFVIAGSGPSRQFAVAEARVGPGNTIRVFHQREGLPEVVSYGEERASEEVSGAVLFVRRKGATERAHMLKPFRSYVKDPDRRLGFWHIVAFAWICNLAMHLGLSDMALFRYARHWSYGLYSAFGMYLGHYVAWICAGVMGAAVASRVMMDTPLTLLDSGEVAFRALGIAGAIAVVIAGWTTSNPTLYRAGLALQVVSPGWPRWLVTLMAGAVTTVIACFPFVFRQLLGFVGLYGLLLMPVGAIVVAEHWIFPRIGLERFWSTRRGHTVNWPALAAWSIALTAALFCWYTDLLHLFFLAAPVWVLTVLLYTVFAVMAGAGRRGPVPPEEVVEPAPPAGPHPAAGRASRYRHYFLALAGLTLLSILAFSFAVSAGYLRPDATMLSLGGYQLSFYGYLVAATVVYFVAGTIWMLLRQRRTSVPAVEAKNTTD